MKKGVLGWGEVVIPGGKRKRRKRRKRNRKRKWSGAVGATFYLEGGMNAITEVKGRGDIFFNKGGGGCLRRSYNLV